MVINEIYQKFEGKQRQDLCKRLSFKIQPKLKEQLIKNDLLLFVR